MLDQLRGLHIEPTNMCTLKCPRCPRTEFVNTFKPKNWDNQNLNLENLKNFLDIDLKNLQILLNGNYGDPIYYPKLFELIKFFKDNNCIITIHTNGSYKNKEWWSELAHLLDNTDTVVFSIDGLPENFTNYRVNADWSSIKQGIEVLSLADCKTIWKYIVFSYNEDNIDQARALSQELGVDRFVLNNSDRWEGNDWLTPKKHVSIPSKDIEDSHSMDGNRGNTIHMWKEQNIRNFEIDPICKRTNSMHFISAMGHYMPCCLVGNHEFYYKSEFYKNKDMYDISKTTLSKVLDNLKDFYLTLEDAKLNYCTFNCPKL